MLFNLFRLTILMLFVFLYFSQFGCYKSENTAILLSDSSQIVNENAVNINTASAEQLKKLPKIGDEMAGRIVEYREKNGRFRRAEHLILVRGMTDKKFREIKNLVKVE
jgi:competence ComEA-like helix-hairpin-helix protein